MQDGKLTIKDNYFVIETRQGKVALGTVGAIRMALEILESIPDLGGKAYNRLEKILEGDDTLPVAVKVEVAFEALYAWMQLPGVEYPTAHTDICIEYHLTDEEAEQLTAMYDESCIQNDPDFDPMFPFNNL